MAVSVFVFVCVLGWLALWGRLVVLRFIWVGWFCLFFWLFALGFCSLVCWVVVRWCWSGLWLCCPRAERCFDSVRFLGFLVFVMVVGGFVCFLGVSMLACCLLCSSCGVWADVQCALVSCCGSAVLFFLQLVICALLLMFSLSGLCWSRVWRVCGCWLCVFLIFGVGSFFRSVAVMFCAGCAVLPWSVW